MSNSLRSQPAIEASLAEQFAPWSQVHEDLSVLAWRSVQRLTPAIAAQEPQAIAEMIQHLRGLQTSRAQEEG